MAGSFPGQTGGDQRRYLALEMRGRCSMCGISMPRGKPVYGIFNCAEGRDALSEAEKHPGGVYVRFSHPGSMHRSCAIYSAMVCPYLRHRRARRHRLRPWEIRRGRAEVLGFDHRGIGFFTETPTNASDNRAWAYFGLAESIPYGSWRELWPLYDDAIAADGKIIDYSSRLHWTDSQEDQNRLAYLSSVDRATVARMRATATTAMGGYVYRLAVLA
ncbi:hypothetical protein A5692_23525 [Mycobacterium sp. E342]|nr:hypothetical protein A5692_23525 [Mycobacterium sp. E342]